MSEFIRVVRAFVCVVAAVLVSVTGYLAGVFVQSFCDGFVLGRKDVRELGASVFFVTGGSGERLDEEAK